MVKKLVELDIHHKIGILIISFFALAALINSGFFEKTHILGASTSILNSSTISNPK